MPSTSRVGIQAVIVAANIWIRNERRTRLSAGAVAAFSIAFAAIVFLIPAHPHFQRARGEYVVELAFILGVAAIFALLARRIACSGLLLASERVVVRGLVRTKSFSLADVEGVSPGVLHGFGNKGTPCPMVRVRHARPAGVWALGQEGWRSNRAYLEALEPLCDELNQLLESLRSAALSTT
jgi:hypothetical protein